MKSRNSGNLFNVWRKIHVIRQYHCTWSKTRPPPKICTSTKYIENPFTSFEIVLLKHWLQKLQNRTARIILQANCEVNPSLLLETLKWDQLLLRRRKQKAIMMFKALKGLAPMYLHELFSERHRIWLLWFFLNLPKLCTDYLKRSLGHSGALLWNCLPESIRAIISIGRFKKEIYRAFETFHSHSAIL